MAGIQLKYVCKTGITTDEFIDDIVGLMTASKTAISDLNGADQDNSVLYGNWGDTPSFILVDSTDIDADNKRRILKVSRSYSVTEFNYIEIVVDVNGKLYMSPCEDYDFTNYAKINAVYYSDSYSTKAVVGDGNVFVMSIHGDTAIIDSIMVTNIYSGFDICDAYQMNINNTNGYYYWTGFAKVMYFDGTQKVGSSANFGNGIMDSIGYNYYNSTTSYNTFVYFINNFVATQLVFNQPLITDLYTKSLSRNYIIKPFNITEKTGVTFMGINDQTVDDIYTTPSNEEYRVACLYDTDQSLLIRVK